ncbi:hypothetical protein [Pontibacillus chungwhensis]|uniref:CsbD family protein n=1 Tax=Pontibacillus chungwhensis TaxID=265426 RepID=A0ABY8V097_9BACI|nr:hypothetical protein [Pontibacillus chungwhensis]MCD5324504.1 hypothetical protein [Pontibacillus sp. HN14]WIF99202.1 hypothetical protein QNI29_05960 [Pontibacillus chungwhensis]
MARDFEKLAQGMKKSTQVEGEKLKSNETGSSEGEGAQVVEGAARVQGAQAQRKRL